jgi:hypothetical protein
MKNQNILTGKALNSSDYRLGTSPFLVKLLWNNNKNLQKKRSGF